MASLCIGCIFVYTIFKSMREIKMFKLGGGEYYHIPKTSRASAYPYSYVLS